MSYYWYAGYRALMIGYLPPASTATATEKNSLVIGGNIFEEVRNFLVWQCALGGNDRGAFLQTAVPICMAATLFLLGVSSILVRVLHFYHFVTMYQGQEKIKVNLGVLTRGKLVESFSSEISRELIWRVDILAIILIFAGGMFPLLPFHHSVNLCIVFAGSVFKIVTLWLLDLSNPVDMNRAHWADLVWVALVTWTISVNVDAFETAVEYRTSEFNSLM